MSGAKSEMMRYCAVLGCRNTAMELRAWRKSACRVHVGEIRENCHCAEPFVLFPFPVAPKFRASWLTRIGLPELEVSDATRVCSLHFVEGKPTPRSYYPTLYLQADISEDDEEDEDDEDEASETSDSLHPHIESSYSCAEGFNNGQTNDNGQDPLNTEEDLADCNQEETNEGFEDEENQDQEYSSSDFTYKMPTENSNSSEMIISQEADCGDEVVLVEQTEEATTSVDEDVQVMYEKPKLVPLASYDPQAQVLQISNPVKYISECHNRIAQLIAEKEEMKKSFESEIERLKYLNTSLKRRFMNSNKRFFSAASQSVNTKKPRTIKKLKMLSKS